MARRITVNIGFITNSSSCVYYFPREVLEDPQVKAFIEAHGLDEGYVGPNLWNREQCSSFLVTEEQKEEAKHILRTWDDSEPVEDEAATPASKVIDPKDDGAYILYGDEYNDTTHILCKMMSEALHRIKGGDPEAFHHAGYQEDFN